jgi:hypothetical protein
MARRIWDEVEDDEDGGTDSSLSDAAQRMDPRSDRVVGRSSGYVTADSSVITGEPLLSPGTLELARSDNFDFLGADAGACSAISTDGCTCGARGMGA